MSTDPTGKSGDVPVTGEHPAIEPPSDGRPSPLLRHDVVVVVGALALLALGSGMYRSMSAPQLSEFSIHGVSFDRPSGLLPPLEIATPRSALGGIAATIAPPQARPTAGSSDLPYHKMWESPDGPLLAVEVLVDSKPDYRGLTMWLQLTRQTRYGEYHWSASSGEVELGDRTWQRAEFQYAVKATDDDAPQVATGIEYATVNGGRLYVVTVHGTESQARRWEELILSTLAVN